MTLYEIKEVLSAEVHVCEEKLNREIRMACGADLMSDVLAFSKEKALMLTGLINPQVVRTAEMMDMQAIVFVRGKTPTQDVLDLAAARSIVVLSTKYPMYIACGKLYEKGLGVGRDED